MTTIMAIPAKPIQPRFSSLPAVCISTALRKLDRVITAMYDAELREHDIRVTQVTILLSIRDAGCQTATDIGRLLALDRSTLSRTLNRLIERGWVDIGSHADARVNPLYITDLGFGLLERVSPAMERAHAAARTLLGEDLAALITASAGRVARPAEGAWDLDP